MSYVSAWVELKKDPSVSVILEYEVFLLYAYKILFDTWYKLDSIEYIVYNYAKLIFRGIHGEVNISIM